MFFIMETFMQARVAIYNSTSVKEDVWCKELNNALLSLNQSLRALQFYVRCLQSIKLLFPKYINYWKAYHL